MLVEVGGDPNGKRLRQMVEYAGRREGGRQAPKVTHSDVPNGAN